MAGYSTDKRRITYRNKRVAVSDGGFFDPTRAATAFEDFLGLSGTLADSGTVTITQTGTPATAAVINATAGAPTAGHGGWLAGSVQNVDAELDHVALGDLPWMSVARAGNGMLVGECAFVIPTALTTRQYGFFLSDAQLEASGTNGALNIQTGTTLVVVADNAAGFIFSSLATDNDGYYTASANATTGGTVTNTGVTGVVDYYTKLRVEIDSAGVCFFYAAISSTLGREQEVVNVTGAVNTVATTSLLIPVFVAAATTTTAVPWELDYIFGAVRG